MYAFLGERYLTYWFNKYTKPLLWPVIFYDITKKNSKKTIEKYAIRADTGKLLPLEGKPHKWK